MKRLLPFLAAFCVATCGVPVFASDTEVPGEPNVQIARFPSGATTVTVDVFNATSATQVGDNVATTRVTLDSGNSDIFYFDLSGVAGYPVNCELTTFILRYAPDGADCNATPNLCAVSDVKVGGRACRADPNKRVDYVYASALVAGQGISQKVRDHYNLRGLEPILWRKILTAEDQDFSTPSHTAWEVYFYEETGPFPRLKCTVVTESDPSVSLPTGC